jgi:hypothetical protein
MTVLLLKFFRFSRLPLSGSPAFKKLTYCRAIVSLTCTVSQFSKKNGSRHSFRAPQWKSASIIFHFSTEWKSAFI